MDETMLDILARATVAAAAATGSRPDAVAGGHQRGNACVLLPKSS